MRLKFVLLGIVLACVAASISNGTPPSLKQASALTPPTLDENRSYTYVTPYSALRPQQITARYHIYNPNSSTYSLYLGLTIFPDGNEPNQWSDGFHDKLVTLPAGPGWSYQTRLFDIPPSSQYPNDWPAPGYYTVWYGLKEGSPGGPFLDEWKDVSGLYIGDRYPNDPTFSTTPPNLLYPNSYPYPARGPYTFTIDYIDPDNNPYGQGDLQQVALTLANGGADQVMTLDAAGTLSTSGGHLLNVTPPYRIITANKWSVTWTFQLDGSWTPSTNVQYVAKARDHVGWGRPTTYVQSAIYDNSLVIGGADKTNLVDNDGDGYYSQVGICLGTDTSVSARQVKALLYRRADESGSGSYVDNTGYYTIYHGNSNERCLNESVSSRGVHDFAWELYDANMSYIVNLWYHAAPGISGIPMEPSAEDQGPNAPGAPYIISSDDTGKWNYDGVTKVTRPTFNWSAASHPGGVAISGYYVSYTNSSPGPGDAWVTSTSWKPPLFGDIPEGGHTLYVRAKDAQGVLGQVSSGAFTIDTTAPSPPTLVAPSENANIADTTPTLDWNEMSGAWKYQVFVREDALIPIDSRTSPEITDSAWTVPSGSELGFKKWGWQVKAWDLAGNEGSYGANAVIGGWGHFEVYDAQVQVDLPVPYYNQGSCVWCWATSTSMLVAYYDWHTKPWEVAAALDKTCSAGGATPTEVHAYLEDWHDQGSPDAWELKLWNRDNDEDLIHDISAPLSKNNPVYVGGWDHAVVVTGYLGLNLTDDVIVNDPSGVAFNNPPVHHHISWQEFINVTNQWRSDGDLSLIYAKIPELVPHGFRGSIEIRSDRDELEFTRTLFDVKQHFFLWWDGSSEYLAGYHWFGAGYPDSPDVPPGFHLNKAATDEDTLEIRAPYVSNSADVPIYVRINGEIRRSSDDVVVKTFTTWTPSEPLREIPAQSADPRVSLGMSVSVEDLPPTLYYLKLALAGNTDDGPSVTEWDSVSLYFNIVRRRPEIGMLISSPDPVIRPGSLTLSATGVTDPNDTILKVEFYRDSNDNGTLETDVDTFLGTDTNGGDGWAWSGTTYGWPLGTSIYFARAQDVEGGWSKAATATGAVQDGPTPTFTPTPTNTPQTPTPTPSNTPNTPTPTYTPTAQSTIDATPTRTYTPTPSLTPTPVRMTPTFTPISGTPTPTASPVTPGPVWSVPINVSNSSADSLQPNFVIDSLDTAQIVWTEGPDPREIYYSAIPDGGAPLSAANISNTAAASFCESIAVDGSGTLHAVWTDQTEGDGDPYYSSKPPNGSWSSPVNIYPTTLFSPGTYIAAESNGDLHVIWSQAMGAAGDIYYCYKPAGVSSWQGTCGDLDEGSGGWPSTSGAEIAVDRYGTVHVVQRYELTQGDNLGVAYRSKPRGGSWSSLQVISNSPSSGMAPAIAADSNGAAYALWVDDREGNNEIYYATNASGSWSSPVNISHTSEDSSEPQIAVDSADTVHVVWQEGSAPSREIEYVSKPQAGSWSVPLNISNTSGDSIWPWIAVDGSGDAHVAWSDNTPGNYEIYYAAMAEASVGGVAEYPGVDASPLETASSPPRSPVALAAVVAGAFLLLVAGGRHARRRGLT